MSAMKREEGKHSLSLDGPAPGQKPGAHALDGLLACRSVT